MELWQHFSKKLEKVQKMEKITISFNKNIYNYETDNEIVYIFEIYNIRWIRSFILPTYKKIFF
jgi:hypothetical protein